MQLKFRFFNGYGEEYSDTEAVNRLRDINEPFAALTDDCIYDFFKIIKGQVHSAEDLNAWMGCDQPDVVVICLIHFTKLKNIVDCAKQWNEELRTKLYVLLFTGNHPSEMCVEASKLAKLCGGAWALKKKFHEFVNSDPWIGMHKALCNCKNQHDVAQLLKNRIPAVNGTETMQMKPETPPPAAGATAFSSSHARNIRTEDLYNALKILLRAAIELDAVTADKSGSTIETLRNPAWWRRGLGNIGQDDITRAIRRAYDVRPNRSDEGWLLIDAFIRRLFTNIQSDEDMLVAAKSAYEALTQ